MKIIDPSTFRRRITIQSVSTAVDAGGGVGNAVITDLFTTWASVLNMSTNRKTYLGMDLFQSAYDIQLRYSAGRDVKTDWLILYGSITLRITSSQLISQDYKQFLVITAVEVSQNG
jgi:head-tail adaptor